MLFAGDQVPLAPLHELVHDRPQLQAGVGEDVLEAAGRVRPPADDARLDEQRQARREDRARDVEMRVQVVEARHPEEEVADDQQRPALADHLQGVGQRARLPFVLARERHARVTVPDSVH